VHSFISHRNLLVLTRLQIAMDAEALDATMITLEPESTESSVPRTILPYVAVRQSKPKPGSGRRPDDECPPLPYDKRTKALDAIHRDATMIRFARRWARRYSVDVVISFIDVGRSMVFTVTDEPRSVRLFRELNGGLTCLL
jgi:hypothetical protein